MGCNEQGTYGGNIYYYTIAYVCVYLCVYHELVILHEIKFDSLRTHTIHNIYVPPLSILARLIVAATSARMIDNPHLYGTQAKMRQHPGRPPADRVRDQGVWSQDDLVSNER